MKNKIKKFSPLALILVILLALSLSATAYAYFTGAFDKNITAGETGKDTTQIVNVTAGDFDTLKAYALAADGKTGIWNDSTLVSAKETRLMITLTGDITLSADLTFVTDSHLDLGGHKLYLDGHELAFRHTYRGTTVVENGTVVVDSTARTADDGTVIAAAKTGKIVFDLPFSYPTVAEDVAFQTRAGLTANAGPLTPTDYYAVLSSDEKTTAYYAFKTVTNKLGNAADGSDLALSYEEVAAAFAAGKITLANGVYTFDPSLFLTGKTCYLADATGNVNHACAFVFRDLDLPKNYLSFDGLTVEYVSSAPEILSASGNFAAPAAAESLTLTVALKKNGTTFATLALPLHAVNPADETSVLSAGKTAIYALMQKTRQTLTVNGSEVSGYVFKRSVQFPKKWEIPGGTAVTFAYEAYDAATDMASVVADRFTDLSAYAVQFEPAENIKRLKITVSCGASSEVLVFDDIYASDAGLIRTPASIAQDFILQHYKDTLYLTMSGADVDGNPTGYNDYELLTPKNGGADPSILGIKYELVNDTNGIYKLNLTTDDNGYVTANGTLSVADFANKNPLDYVESVQLKCTFLFAGKHEEVILVGIKCERDAGGDSPTNFLPYYTYYDQMFFATTGNYSVKTFTMPFAYRDEGPFVVYDAALDPTDKTTFNAVPGLTVSLSYGSTNLNLPAGYTTWIDAFSDTDKKPINVSDLIAAGDARWVFTINPAEIGTTNVEFEILYGYAMTTGSLFTSYTSAGKYKTTSFTLPGVLTSAEMPDGNFYQWTYEAFGGETYASGSVILTDWLKQNVALDVTNATYGSRLQQVQSFQGAEYLLGTTTVNLSKMNFSANYAEVLGYLTRMPQVEELNLSNCGLSSGSTTEAPTDSALALLKNLTRLTTLYLHNTVVTSTTDLPKNTIYSFEFLLDLSSLSKVYVYNNLDSSSVGGIFYGSKGLVNLEYFAELTSSGVAVYNAADVASDSSENPTLYEEMEDVNDYKCLKTLEYQKKIKAGSDISAVYQSFSTNRSDYALKSSYRAGNTTYAVLNTSTLAFGYDGDKATATRFYLQYTIRLQNYGTPVTVKVYFDVVRI